MKFGKLLDISEVDFTLPPADTAYLPGLSGQSARADFAAYVGLPRWASKDWVGSLYPKGTKQADFLWHYARAFSCIELNSTHYRSPSPEQVRKWRDMAPAGFHFCPKIPQVISHYRKLVNCREEITAFVDAIAHFEANLGCSFVQLHDSFGPYLLENLASFLQQWPQGVPLAVEFRHPGWFVEHQLIGVAAELLHRHGVGVVLTDVAGRRDVLHQTLTAPWLVWRFVGNGLHETDFTRLQAWGPRLNQWIEQGLEQFYVFVHQPGDTLAAEMGARVIDQLNQALGAGHSPVSLDNGAGEQMKLF